LFTVGLLLHTKQRVTAQTFESVVMQTALPTVTVRGFLNFRTTVDGTVIVFTPASAATLAASITPSFQTPIAPQTTAAPPAPMFSSIANQDNQATPALPTATALPFAIASSNVATPSTAALPVSSAPYPTGLVTVLSSTAVHSGQTTELQTRVYGTYINGKYAQILKSSARLVQPSAVQTSSQPSATIQAITQPSSPTNYQQQPRWPKPDVKLRPSLPLSPQTASSATHHQQPSPSRKRAEDERSNENGKPEERNSVIIKQNRLNRLGLNSARFQQTRAQHKASLLRADKK
jgi:hypothetical protein